LVHPALAEARQLRLVQQRLLGSIELCDPRMGTRSAESVHGGRAAGRELTLDELLERMCGSPPR